MIETLSDFNDLLERELTQIIGNSAFISESKTKIIELFSQIKEHKENLFEQKFSDDFFKINEEFKSKTKELEETIMEQIRDQFQHMKSSLDRFQMLEKFKVLENKNIMKGLIGNKFSDVLDS